MSKKNAFYAQSGGVTAVINATACGLIEAARQHGIKVFAGHNGITGALKEELIDTTQESDEAIAALRHTPGGAFGSCRYQMKSIEEDPREYERLIEVFAAHDIGYFFYNGGGDSQDTTYKISQISEKMGYPLVCIGLPKTVDNDLPHTDTCPGFGSAAKYIATSILEGAYDVMAMAATSTKVFILEVMGRQAGWLAAAAGLAAKNPSDPPQILLFPEVPFDTEAFLGRVDQCVKEHGYCAIVVAEGIRNKEGHTLHDAGYHDVFGHTQLGGVAPVLSRLIKKHCDYRCHSAVADYLQRSARHLTSKTDIEQAYAIGKAAIEAVNAGMNNVMLTIVRESTQAGDYQWSIGDVPLAEIIKDKKNLPADFISQDGFHITEKCREYLAPLIRGEDYPPYKNGLPHYAQLKNVAVPKKLAAACEA